jgi:hypothetical protein
MESHLVWTWFWKCFLLLLRRKVCVCVCVCSFLVIETVSYNTTGKIVIWYMLKSCEERKSLCIWSSGKFEWNSPTISTRDHMVTMNLPCGILPMWKFIPKPAAPYCLTPRCTLNNNPLEACIPSMQHLWNDSLGARLEHVDLFGVLHGYNPPE